MKKFFSIALVCVLAVSVLSVLVGCSSADPIVGEWSICSVLDGDEIVDPIGIEEFAFWFNEDNSGRMSTSDGAYVSFKWEYFDGSEEAMQQQNELMAKLQSVDRLIEEGVRFYDISYEDGGLAVALLDPDDTLCIPYTEFSFIFERVE